MTETAQSCVLKRKFCTKEGVVRLGNLPGKTTKKRRGGGGGGNVSTQEKIWIALKRKNELRIVFGYE